MDSTLGRSSENHAPGGAAKPYYLTEQNEQGVILYLSNKSVENVQIDGYFIYKRDAKELANGDNADIYHRWFQDYRHAGGALVMFSRRRLPVRQQAGRYGRTLMSIPQRLGATSTPTPAKSGSIIFSRIK